MAMMRYAFKELGLHRLDAEMINYNNRSIDFYTHKCGWVLRVKRAGLVLPQWSIS